MTVDTFMIMTRTLAEGPNIDDTLALCTEVEKLRLELADLRVQESAKGSTPTPPAEEEKSSE